MPRLHVMINDETSVAIKTLMSDQGRSATEVVHRAISLYAFLVKAQNKGQTVLLRKKNGDLYSVEVR